MKQRLKVRGEALKGIDSSHRWYTYPMGQLALHSEPKGSVLSGHGLKHIFPSCSRPSGQIHSATEGAGVSAKKGALVGAGGSFGACVGAVVWTGGRVGAVVVGSSVGPVLG